MKTLTMNVAIAVLMLVSLPVLADDKVVITGEPVVLEHTGDVYTLPSGYVETTSTYHYVTVDGSQRVCYAETQPSLASLDVMAINVSVGGDSVVWHCYETNPTYFEIKP